MRAWFDGCGRDKQEILNRLTSDSVKAHRNKRLGDNSDSGGGEHNHGSLSGGLQGVLAQHNVSVVSILALCVKKTTSAHCPARRQHPQLCPRPDGWQDGECRNARFSAPMLIRSPGNKVSVVEDPKLGEAWTTMTTTATRVATTLLSNSISTTPHRPSSTTTPHRLNRTTRPTVTRATINNRPLSSTTTREEVDTTKVEATIKAAEATDTTNSSSSSMVAAAAGTTKVQATATKA